MSFPTHLNPLTQMLEFEKKEAIERKNLEVVENVYRRLEGDLEIMEDIEKIKSHPWVGAM